MARTITPTQVEVFFDKSDIIVSKTDLKGRITYANKPFIDIAGYSRAEVIGAPHSLIRHPDMPRAIFKLLWDTLGEGKEIFAYVKNMTKRGDHYWVLAHVTPSRDGTGQVVGYHSNRRVPDRTRLDGVFIPLYAELNRIERSHANAKQGLAASSQLLADTLTKRGISYDEFVFTA
jgi:PAS domain S-box-containing protein